MSKQEVHEEGDGGAPTNAAGPGDGGNVAGLDDNPPAKLAADRKKKKKEGGPRGLMSFSQFAAGQQ